MNFEYNRHSAPLKVLMTNPLVSPSKLIIFKMLAGAVFGAEQLIDLVLLSYENETHLTQAFKIELEECAFILANTITVTSNLPSISDADVFCFLTNFSNPNSLDFSAIGSDDEQFDTLYLLIKIANNFSLHPPPRAKESDDKIKNNRKKSSEPIVKRKQIFIADGLVALDIIMSFSKIIPRDVLFCPTSIPCIAKSVLGESLKVQCDSINEVLVWAGNDRILHVEVKEPLLVYDPVEMPQRQCIWSMMKKEMLEKMNLDHTQFNAYWMKKEFIEMVTALSSSNPYGPIYKATKMARTLKSIWCTRTAELKTKHEEHCESMGVISDGSLGTTKGLPYILPLVFVEDSYTIDQRFKDTTYLQHVIKNINKAVQEHHKKLIPYCKKFLLHNVINQEFVPSSESTYTFSHETKSFSSDGGHGQTSNAN